MLRSSIAPGYEDVPVLHDGNDEDELPPIRPLASLMTMSPAIRQAREAHKAKARRRTLIPDARERRDSVVPVGITIPPLPPTGFAVAALKETRHLNILMSRLSRTTALFATAIIGLLVLLVVKGQLAKTTAAESEESRQPAALPAPSPVPSPPKAEAAAAPAAPAIDRVEVGLSANAPDAEFRIDDGPWLANPYTGHVPRDDREHHVEARAEGFFPRVTTVRFTKDTLLEVTLQKITSRPAPARPAKRKDQAASSRSAPPPAPAPVATDEARPPSALEPARVRLPRPIDVRTPYE
jgi:hypothetical protein